MNRLLRIGTAVSAGVLVIALSVAAPNAMRRMDGFRVRRVEVRGTHYLPPAEALRVSGITHSSNVFDDFGRWQAALEQHPLVVSARVERVLPGTLRLFIVEAEPIALIARAGGPSAGELLPISAAGELLPVDPSVVDLDLPIISAPAYSETSSARVRAAVNLLGRIRTAESALYGWISDVDATSQNHVRVRLRSPANAEALLPVDPDAARLRQLRITLAHLAARRDLNDIVRIDARFRDQIVVALTSKAAS